MSDFEVEVVGARRKLKSRRPLSRLLGWSGRFIRALLMRPRAVMVLGVAGFVLFVGTPHAGWDYECRHPFSPEQPCRSVVYCAYYGIQGRRVVFPESGESCKLVTFLPISWRRVFAGKLTETEPSTGDLRISEFRLQVGTDAGLSVRVSCKLHCQYPCRSCGLCTERVKLKESKFA